MSVPHGFEPGLSCQNVQRISNELEKLGFVTFEGNPDHKRAKLVVLTPSCRRTLEKLQAIQAGWANKLADGIDETTLKRTVQAMRVIRERCEAIERTTEQS